MKDNTWVTYEDSDAAARKRVEAGQILVTMSLHRLEERTYNLVIEAGIESVSVTLHSNSLGSAFSEADQFARDYFLDRARLLEEIAERI